MRDQTIRLDDGATDAGKIGQKVAQACRAESTQAAQVFIAGKSPEDRAEFLKNVRADETELATRVVRQLRAEKS